MMETGPVSSMIYDDLPMNGTKHDKTHIFFHRDVNNIQKHQPGQPGRLVKLGQLRTSADSAHFQPDV